MTPERVTCGNGKYAVVFDERGLMTAERNGQPWPARDLTGDNLVRALAADLAYERKRADAPAGRASTPHEQMVAALRDALALLASDPRPEADALADRIVGLLEPPKCHADGCDQFGNHTAYRRDSGDAYCESVNDGGVFRVCYRHAREYADRGNPEYHKVCDNCGCRLPVA